MLKTVKVKKKMRLDELIKYVWENSATEKRVFLGNHGQRVVFDNVGGFYPSGYAYSPDTTFAVEVEEAITEDTVFEMLTEVFYDFSSDSVESLNIPDARISYILGEQRHSEDFETLAIYYGKTRIWEAE